MESYPEDFGFKQIKELYSNDIGGKLLIEIMDQFE
jgi:hypothetical protein